MFDNMDVKVDLKNPKQRFAAFGAVSVLLIITLLVLCNISYAYAYRGRFFPGATVGLLPIGGMTFADGRALVNARADALIEKGAEVRVNGSQETIPLRVIATEDPDLSQDLVTLKVDEALAQAEALGQTGSEFRQSWEMMVTALGQSKIEIPVEVNVDAIQAELLKTFAEEYHPAKEPAFVFANNEDEGWSVSVASGASGRAFNVEAAVDQFTQTMRNLNRAPVAIAVMDQKPLVSWEEQLVVDEALAVVVEAPYEMLYR